MLNIVIFGGPGSGKGTQSELIAEKYNLLHISTGDVLRKEIASGSEVGQTADSYISKGYLIPDELMITILAGVVDGNKGKEGVIFDGFPRTLPQAEALDSMLLERNMPLKAVLALDVPQFELIDRLIKRGEKSGRSDDNLETIKTRLNIYEEKTSPILDYYAEKEALTKIQGIGTIDEIFNRICQKIDA